MALRDKMNEVLNNRMNDINKIMTPSLHKFNMDLLNFIEPDLQTLSIRQLWLYELLIEMDLKNKQENFNGLNNKMDHVKQLVADFFKTPTDTPNYLRIGLDNLRDAITKEEQLLSDIKSQLHSKGLTAIAQLQGLAASPTSQDVAFLK